MMTPKAFLEKLASDSYFKSYESMREARGINLEIDNMKAYALHILERVEKEAELKEYEGMIGATWKVIRSKDLKSIFEERKKELNGESEISAEILRLKQKRKELILSNKRIKELESKKRKEWQSRLKHIIELRCKTYSEIGDEIGVSRQAISKWANMQKSINELRAKQLSIILNYDL